MAGYFKSVELRRKAETADALCQDISILMLKMEYSNLPLKQLVQQLDSMILIRFWQNFSAALDNNTVFFAWAEAIKKEQKQNPGFAALKAGDIVSITEFGKNLGITDIAAQKKNFNLFKQILEEKVKAYKSDSVTKGRMYRSIGLLGGLAVAIMMV